jgi:two-component system alkaline phosphatase synthesis response regulator PhoP
MTMLEILIVDDDLEVLATLSRGLRASGHSVAVARDGLVALDTARTSRPDVIIADIRMPGLNGFQLCRRLRQTAETRDVAVFLMSDKVEPVDHLWANEVGARALLAKPLEAAHALAQLATIVRVRREPERET